MIDRRKSWTYKILFLAGRTFKEPPSKSAFIGNLTIAMTGWSIFFACALLAHHNITIWADLPDHLNASDDAFLSDKARATGIYFFIVAIAYFLMLTHGGSIYLATKMSELFSNKPKT